MVITGESAGGLATILHINWWGDMLGEKYNAMGVSDGGFFLDYDTFNTTTSNAGEDDNKDSGDCFHEYFVESYHDQMRHIYNRSNADINRDCVEYFTSLAGGEAPATTALEEENLGPEACMFAQHS